MAEIPVKMDIVNRTAIERKLARALGKTFSQQLNELLAVLGDPPDINNLTQEYWNAMDEKMRAVLMPTLADIFNKQISAIIDELSFGVDWALVNEWAIEWARGYTFEMVGGITERTRSVLFNAIEAYYRDGLSKDDLAELIQPSFGPVRAEMIATTETTRASVQGEMSVVKWIEKNNPNIRMIAYWATANDELVCNICGPRNGKAQGDGWTDPPPAHPRCRCWLNHEMTIIE